MNFNLPRRYVEASESINPNDTDLEVNAIGYTFLGFLQFDDDFVDGQK